MKLQGVKNFPTTIADLDRLFRGLFVEPSEDSVGSNQIKTAAIITTKIADGAVSLVKLANADADGKFPIRRGGSLVYDVLADSDIPGTLARDADVTTEIASAIDAHEAEVDPHTQYMTAADVTTATNALNLASGVYTPTLTNLTNLDATTAFTCQYLRVGSVVTVSGLISVNPTAAGATQVALSLPIASNFAASEDCGGCAFAPGIAGQGAAFLADVVNNRAFLQWVAVDTTNQNMSLTFTYRVI